MSPNKQSNVLQFSGLFERDNYIAKACPSIQSYCGISEVTSWWLGQVRLNVESFGGEWDDDWEGNLCIGEDNVVRYVTATGFVNTCTGYDYVEGKEKETFCGSQPLWQCGFKTYAPYTDLSPGFPINQFRSIALAMIQEDKLLPECSFANNNFCNADFPEQDAQPRYSIDDKDTICAPTDHSQYHASIDSVKSQIINKQNAAGDTRAFDLCYLEDQDGDLEYLLFVDGIGYPTCISAPLSEEDCPTDKFICIEAPFHKWAGSIINRFGTGLIISNDPDAPPMRKNHQHYECPSIRDICLPGYPSTSNIGGLTSAEQKSFIPSEQGNVGGVQTPEALTWFAETFENNICIGRDSAIRVVTPQGIQSTCVGYSWDESLTVPPQENPCPTSRNFMCGSLQIKSDGQAAYGWLSAQVGLVQEALRQANDDGEGAVHPQCPYTQCREC